jgi:hypothetical protein
MGDDADIPITKSILDDVVDKLVRMIGDNGKEANVGIVSNIVYYLVTFGLGVVLAVGCRVRVGLL